MKQDLQKEYDNHIHNGTDSKKLNFENFEIVANASITAPTGGGTVDSQARTAINSIITELENRGFINNN